MIEQNIPTVKSTFAPTFYSKVYLAFGSAVAVSTLGAYLGLNFFVQYFIQFPALTYVLFGAELLLILTSRLWSQKSPLNYILFASFAFVTGLTLVPILAYLSLSGGIGLVIKALIATTLMFGASALFGATTNYNLQGIRGFLGMSLIGMIVISLIGLFFPWGNLFEMIYSGIGVLVFSAFVMVDVQRIHQYPENQYIDAALELYLDIFNLFLHILRLLMSLNRR